MQDERTGKLKKKPQPPKSKVQTQQIKPDRNNNDNFFQDEEGFDFSGGFTNSGNNGNKTAIYKIKPFIKLMKNIQVNLIMFWI